MANARWKVWTIARCINERDLVFEPIKGKHLYHTGLGNNYIQHEEKTQVTGALFLHEESNPSDPKTPRNVFLSK